MTFEVIILGSTSALPTTSKNHTSQLINVNEQYYLIDCGEGTQVQLRKAGIKFQRIKHIFISHLHGDHYLGLPGLLFSMHLLGRKNKLTIYGPPELEPIIKLQTQLYNGSLGFELVFVYTQAKTFQLLMEDKYTQLFSFPLKHSIPTTGFLIKEKKREPNILREQIARFEIPIDKILGIKNGDDFITDTGICIPNEKLIIHKHQPRSYAFCSDTAYNEAMIPHIQGVDMLYHEATFLKNMQARANDTKHSTTNDAAEIANKAGVKYLLIGHLSVRYLNPDEVMQEVITIFENAFYAKEGRAYGLNLRHEIEINSIFSHDSNCR